MTSATIEDALTAAVAGGAVVALVRIVDGPGTGRELLVWPAGEALGDLGSPRLNQRVALYVEGLIVRGGDERKSFDTQDGEVEIETVVHGSPSSR